MVEGKEILKISIPLNPITKKNSQRIVPIRLKTGAVRNTILPSSQFLKFEKNCGKFLQKIKNDVEKINYPINVKCLFYMETRRKVDLTNLLEAVDDILTKYGIIEDDNRDIIASHDGSRVYYDKYNPRIEITITEEFDYAQWGNYTRQENLFKLD